MSVVVWAWLGVSILVVGGCDGARTSGAAVPGADAASGTGPDAGTPGGDATGGGGGGEFFIRADIDGVEARADMQPAGGEIPGSPGNISIFARSPSVPYGGSWTLYMPNSVGTAACGQNGAIYTWVALGAGWRRSDYPGGTCSVTVTAAAPAVGDVVEGTFTATLAAPTPDGGALLAVTNGAFRVLRR